jgi:tetratricopeptide (TPR) repeat protein
VEVLVALADKLSAAAPTVLVADDLQWADEASLIVWHQLAASIDQLRLLLIATCRPTPRPEVQQVRAAVVRRGGAVITLGPLPETEVAAMVTAMVGAPPGEMLRRLTGQAAGNPLYVRELVDALVREQALEIKPTADIVSGSEQLLPSLPAVLDGRLSSVSEEAAQILRAAALLGRRFAVSDLSVVLRRPVVDLAAGLREAVDAGIVDGAGAELAFRHPLIRESLYESTPEALRTALHAEAARELAAVGADVLSVAQQLSSAGRPGAGWSRAWLVQVAPALASKAPQLAVELQRRELEETPVGDEAWDALIAGLIRALLNVGGYQEAIAQANRALAVMTDPARRGETFWMLTHARGSAGLGNEAAVSTMRQALAAVDLPLLWRARLLALLAMFEREVTGFDASHTLARQALTAADEVGDLSTTAQALVAVWLINSVGRDHATALESIDRALLITSDDPSHDDLHATALDARTFTLQNLDEWERAALALRQSREFALRASRPDRATWASAAVLWYWLGQWDDALAEMDSDATDVPGLVYSWLRERWSALLVHGLAALIAGRRAPGPAHHSRPAP